MYTCDAAGTLADGRTYDVSLSFDLDSLDPQDYGCTIYPVPPPAKLPVRVSKQQALDNARRFAEKKYKWPVLRVDLSGLTTLSPFTPPGTPTYMIVVSGGIDTAHPERLDSRALVGVNAATGEVRDELLVGGWKQGGSKAGNGG
jgi:hypothetical protein